MPWVFFLRGYQGTRVRSLKVHEVLGTLVMVRMTMVAVVVVVTAVVMAVILRMIMMMLMVMMVVVAAGVMFVMMTTLNSNPVPNICSQRANRCPPYPDDGMMPE